MLLQMFPENVATIYSFTESSFSFAEMIGPTFGAVLYNAGGFILPFEFCGGLCLLTGLFTICVLPKKSKPKMTHLPSIIIDGKELEEIKETKPLLETLKEDIRDDTFERSSSSDDTSNDNQITVVKSSPSWDKIRIAALRDEVDLAMAAKSSTITKRTLSVKTEVTARSFRSHRGHHHVNQEAAAKSNVGLLTVLKNVKVIMALSGTVFGASVQGLLEANLEQFLEGFDLSINQIGYSFLGLSIPYFIVSPCWGYTCDHWVHPKIIQPLGHVVTTAGLLILAPVSYLTPNVRILKNVVLGRNETMFLS